MRSFVRGRGRGSTEEGGVNPFIVLADLLTTVLLLLVFYFAILFSITGSELAVAKGKLRQIADREEKIQKYKRIVTKAVRESKGISDSQKPFIPDIKGDTQIFRFNADILFDRGVPTPKPDAVKILEKFAEVIGPVLENNRPEGLLYPEIEVQGHTDVTPYKNVGNWRLSTERALNVLSELTTQGKMRTEYMSAVGYSCHRPLQEPANDPKNMKVNRRVEIRLIYATDDESNDKKFKNGKPCKYDCYEPTH